MKDQRASKTEMKKIILSIVLFIILVSLAKLGLPKKDFILTESNGTTYFQENQQAKPESYINFNRENFYLNNELKKGYKIYKNDKTGFSFIYPEEFILRNISLTGHEEYFTLPNVIFSEIFSYPGELDNPENSDKYHKLSIKIVFVKGEQKNTERWFENLQNNKFNKDIIDRQGTKIIKYLGSFSQKKNIVLIASDSKATAIIVLMAKDEQSFEYGKNFIEVIQSTLSFI